MQPELPPLSRSNRRFVFISMLVSFTVLVPVLVFYAIGYRYDFETVGANFKVVGGLYISTEEDDTDIFLDEEPVEDMRIFQRAAYIQNVPDGIHRVHVEGEGLVTWVKELPVFSHLVTEARSFNLPAVPQVRVITPWINPVTQVGVFLPPMSSSTFAIATTTNSIEFATTTATSTYLANSEYTYLVSLFASSTKEMYATQRDNQTTNQFTFDRTLINQVATATATTTKLVQSSVIYERDGEVYVGWLGDNRTIPHYFCLYYQGIETAQLYGTHVYEQLIEQVDVADSLLSMQRNKRICRNEIRIDRLWQEVQYFNFMPGNTDLVLMHLENGVYVVEVDDRAWQNTQLLYPGTDLQVLIDGRQIYIFDGIHYLEVYTELIP
jgi:hypothetical protein